MTYGEVIGWCGAIAMIQLVVMLLVLGGLCARAVEDLWRGK